MKRLIILSILCVLAMPLFCHAADNTIFVIESYHEEYAWDASYKEGLEETLGNLYDLVYFQMDTKRLPASQHQERVDLAYKEYKRLDPALVILGDDNALKFIGPKLSGTKTPVVYLGINQNPRYYNMFGPKNITGVLERPLMKRSVLFLKEMLDPEPQKILILFDTGATSKSSVAQVFKGKNSVEIAGIKTDLKMIGNLSVWKRTVLSAKKDGYDAIIVGLYQTITDNMGIHVDGAEILEWTSENTPIPPFGFWDFTVGKKKTIGGLVLFGKIQGQTAGKIALEVLSGKTPYDIHPVIAEKGRILFSKTLVEKWGLNIPEDLKQDVEYVE